MAKKLFISIIITFIFSISSSLSAFAMSVYVDGTKIPSDEFFIVDDRVYMSLRDITEYSNYDISYNNDLGAVNFNSENKPKNNNIPTLFPVNVSEVYNEENSQTIIKTYELGINENPQNIPSDDFEQGKFTYKLSDITKTGNITTDNKEHLESATVETSTNNIDAVLNELDKTKEVTTEDGYVGILTLDVNSIKSEVKGYKNSSQTLTETREFQNLSSPDTALIPKRISKNGRQYNLSNIDWNNTQNTSIDDVAVSQNYKATATYTVSATKSTLTGYTTTAEYKGIVSKQIAGKTIYTAYFDGVPTKKEVIKPPVMVESLAKINDKIAKDVAPKQENSNSILMFFIILIAIFLILGEAVFFYVYIKKKLSQDVVEETQNETEEHNVDTK